MAKTEYRDDELLVNYTGEPFSGSGIVSQVTWDSPDLQAGLRAVFKCTVREQIIAVVVTRQGDQSLLRESPFVTATAMKFKDADQS